MTPPEQPPGGKPGREPRRRHPVLRTTAAAIATALVLAVAAFLVYAHITFAAERAPVEALAADPAVTTEWTYDHVILTPADPDGTGLVFLAGAKVDPLAYADKLSGVAASGTTIVVVRPVLNFAIAEFRTLEAFTSLAPDVEEWFVGGHSLGGVKACQYAADPAVTGLVLFASYCAGDESGLGKPVLSLSGENDGLSTPAKIEASRDALPSDTIFVQLPGATHAQFGDYGLQPGDGAATTTDAAVRSEITAALTDFIRTSTATG
ncbi:alpha/beta hydrolase [Herbiconiux sp.]|uniref:alpha/beta hydrolase n=1 Tax=Herbiconiux sp. TaxID=1871186 RepID=UPI0025BDC673|nr:alpha/beta hydrolase [Herbiconiux sp.]